LIKRKHFGIPYAVFMVIFVLMPILLIIFYAFTNADGNFTLENVTGLFTEQYRRSAILRSVGMGISATAICLLIGYPVAYILSNRKYNKISVLIILFLVPMWVHFLLRTIATRELLQNFGLLEFSYFAVLFGLVYNFLPFMIFPIYSSLMRMDYSLQEASSDLGATNMQTFTRVIVPMSVPGIMAGTVMVLTPAISTFVISDILSSGRVRLLGDLIFNYFEGRQHNVGAALSLVLFMLVFVSLLLSKEEKTGRGASI